jgi:hypothetical protein
MGRENMSVFVDKEFFFWKKPKKKNFFKRWTAHVLQGFVVCLSR